MEKKDIKQFLHLYFGCEVSVTNIEGRYTRFIDYDFFQSYYNEDEGEFLNDPKICLRPLSSMTEEEALELAKIYSGAPKPKRIIGGRAVVSNLWYFECFDEHHLLIIGTTGEAWYEHYFDKSNEDGHRNIVNSHDATVYLLSKGFDLFNLIPEGLAIDSTLKPV